MTTKGTEGGNCEDENKATTKKTKHKSNARKTKGRQRRKNV